MPRSPIPRSSTRVFVAALAAASWIGGSAPAGAASTDEASLGAPQASEIELWKGRFCTAASCRNAPASPLAAAASFGAAVLAIGWLARRPGERPAAPGSTDSGRPSPRGRARPGRPRQARRNALR